MGLKTGHYMRRSQLEAIHQRIGKNFLIGREPKEIIRVTPLKGRQRGKIGIIIEMRDSTIMVGFEDGEITAKFQYTQIELVDEAGNMIIESVTDMTGRLIEEGAVICYSVAFGNNSHACEIGKVVRINPAGGITAMPLVRNGEKIDHSRYYFGARERKNLSSNRILLLPVDVTMVTMWLLSGFEVFKADEMGA